MSPGHAVEILIFQPQRVDLAKLSVFSAHLMFPLIIIDDLGKKLSWNEENFEKY